MANLHGVRTTTSSSASSLNGWRATNDTKHWINRWAEWRAKRRVDKSSEDIWAMRTEPRKSFPREIRQVLENTEKTFVFRWTSAFVRWTSSTSRLTKPQLLFL
ncbi:hypothetical protein EDD85DRAFT_858132 [Armillaria nabsnona]|nr:hypothetical protein EDD85DRAFT_858132 [Armillaria nabsnona]